MNATESDVPREVVRRLFVLSYAIYLLPDEPEQVVLGVHTEREAVAHEVVEVIRYKGRSIGGAVNLLTGRDARKLERLIRAVESSGGGHREREELGKTVEDLLLAGEADGAVAQRDGSESYADAVLVVAIAVLAATGGAPLAALAVGGPVLETTIGAAVGASVGAVIGEGARRLVDAARHGIQQESQTDALGGRPPEPSGPKPPPKDLPTSLREGRTSGGKPVWQDSGPSADPLANTENDGVLEVPENRPGAAGPAGGTEKASGDVERDTGIEPER